MAPEQVLGEPLTPAADIYSLGVVLYEMLTGKLPFTGGTPLSTALKRLTEPPLPPTKHIPDIPQRWEQIILKCLQREPHARFESAADFVEAIQTGRPIKLEAPRRKKITIGLTATLVIALAIATIFAGLRRNSKAPNDATAVPAKRRPIVAVLGFKNTSESKGAIWYSTALSEMIATELAAGEELRVVPGDDIARIKLDMSLPEGETLAKDNLSLVSANLGADFLVSGTLFAAPQKGSDLRIDVRLIDGEGAPLASFAENASSQNLATAASNIAERLRERFKAGALSEQQIRSAQRVVPSDPEAARLYSEGLARLRALDAQSAIQLLTKAREREPEHPGIRSQLSLAWSILGYDTEATTEARRALELAADTSNVNRTLLEARVYELSGNWSKATDLYRSLTILAPDNLDYGLRLANAQLGAGKALEAIDTLRKESQLPKPLGDDPRIQLQIADAQASISDFEAGLSSARIAVTTATKRGSRLLVARAKVTECWILKNLAQFEDALKACDEARQIYVTFNDKIGLANAVTNLGNVELDRGDAAGALKSYESALEVATQVGARKETAGALLNVGKAQLLLGNVEASKKSFEKSIQVYRQLGNKAGVALALNNTAGALYSHGDLRSAKLFFEQSLAIAEEIGDKEAIARAGSNLAMVMADSGELRYANKQYERVLSIGREINSPNTIAAACRSLGDLHIAEGDFVLAEKRLNEAAGLQNRSGEQEEYFTTLLSLSKLALEQGQFQTAEKYAQQASDGFRSLKDKDYESLAEVFLSRAHLLSGNLVAAEADLHRALTLEPSDRSVRLELKLQEGRVARTQGRVVDAIKSFELAQRDATQFGLLGLQLEAMLSLGETELSSKSPSAKSILIKTRDLARINGFKLISVRAATVSKKG